MKKQIVITTAAILLILGITGAAQAGPRHGYNSRHHNTHHSHYKHGHHKPCQGRRPSHYRPSCHRHHHPNLHQPKPAVFKRKDFAAPIFRASNWSSKPFWTRSWRRP